MTNMLETDVAIVGDGCDPNVLAPGRRRARRRRRGRHRRRRRQSRRRADRKKHSKARCIARVNNPKNKLIFESLDTDQPVTVISSTEIILDIIDDRVNATTLETLARLGKGDLELVQLSILADSPASGRRIADLALPTRQRDRRRRPRRGRSRHSQRRNVFAPGDAVIAMIKHAARGDVCAALVG